MTLCCTSLGAATVVGGKTRTADIPAIVFAGTDGRSSEEQRVGNGGLLSDLIEGAGLLGGTLALPSVGVVEVTGDTGCERL